MSLLSSQSPSESAPTPLASAPALDALHLVDPVAPMAPDAGLGCAAPQGAPLDDPLGIFWIFLRLGLTSFGGPVAHLAYFRAEFVARRHWLSERSYADLVALCQLLPGPASSQVGIALGLGRAGWRGAVAAWMGFTLPSAMALILFAAGVTHWAELAQSGAVHGLKVAAVAVVAHAVWGMSKSLCPDWPRAGIAMGAAVVVLAVPTTFGQIGAMVLGAWVGYVWLTLPAMAPASTASQPAHGVSRRTGALLLGLFAALLAVLPALSAALPRSVWPAVQQFYQAGALVFGGGHVVLPWLQAGVVAPGWVPEGLFVAGYGAAQAVPGPLFTFAAYLGALMPSPWGGWAGGLAALLVIFLPSFLLVGGALGFWQSLSQRSSMRRTMAGVNASVVGVLAAALYQPVWTSAIHTWPDLVLAVLAFGLLVYARSSPVWVVALAAAVGWLGAGWGWWGG